MSSIGQTIKKKLTSKITKSEDKTKKSLSLSSSLQYRHDDMCL